MNMGAVCEHGGCSVSTWWVQCVNMVGAVCQHDGCSV